MTCVVQMTIPMFTNIPSDVVTNTWHFDWTNDPLLPGPTQAQSLVFVLGTFYEQIFGGSPGTMAAYMRPDLASAKVYDLEQPEPRVALWEGPIAITATKDAVNTTIPTEAAACVSYRAAYTSGADKATLRGRIFLGGIGDACVDKGSVTTFPRLLPDWRTDIAAFVQSMQSSAAAENWEWVVYSRKNQSSSPVVAGWIDNAIDTQRRRSVQATSRTVWS